MKSLQQARHPRLANQASPLQDRQLWDPSGGRGDRPSEVRGLGYLKGAAELGSCGPLLSHALLREQAVCGMPGPRTKLPNHGYLQNRPAVGGVGFPSKSQSPVRPLDQRETPVGEGSWDLLEADEGLVGTEGPHQCRHPRITDGIALQAANRERGMLGVAIPGPTGSPCSSLGTVGVRFNRAGEPREQLPPRTALLIIPLSRPRPPRSRPCRSGQVGLS